MAVHEQGRYLSPVPRLHAATSLALKLMYVYLENLTPARLDEGPASNPIRRTSGELALRLTNLVRYNI